MNVSKTKSYSRYQIGTWNKGFTKRTNKILLTVINFLVTGEMFLNVHVEIIECIQEIQPNQKSTLNGMCGRGNLQCIFIQKLWRPFQQSNHEDDYLEFSTLRAILVQKHENKKITCNFITLKILIVYKSTKKEQLQYERFLHNVVSQVIKTRKICFQTDSKSLI